MAENFSSRLQKLRKEHGFTQAQLGKKLGKADSTVRMWELGKNQPDHEVLLRLACIFGVSTDYLLCWSDTRQAQGKQNGDRVMDALNSRPALQSLLELTHDIPDEDLEAVLRITQGFLHK